MNTKTYRLFSLAIYYMLQSFVKANIANFMPSSLNRCLEEGTDFWTTNWSSLIYCAIVCMQDGYCTGITYNKTQGTCRSCTTYGIPGQPPHSEADLFRKTKGDQCDRYLVEEIPDSFMSASSEYDAWGGHHSPPRGRLSSTGSVFIGAWVAAAEDSNKYIQARFNSTKEVRAIVTKGRHNFQLQCVTSYEVSYSMDCVSFAHVTDADNTIKVFPGNNDTDTSVSNMLQESFLALCVRLHPKTWIWFAAMRFDIIGCDL